MLKIFKLLDLGGGLDSFFRLCQSNQGEIQLDYPMRCDQITVKNQYQVGFFVERMGVSESILLARSG